MAVDNAQIILTGPGAFALAWGLASASAATETQASPAATAHAGSRCAECHSIRDADHVGKWRRSVHARAHVGCAGCHGGDESRPDKTGAHGAAPRGVTRSAAAACADCHQAVVAIYKTSRHAAATARGKPAPGCADCHARAGSELLEGGELEKRCATCHRTGGVAGKTWVPRKAIAALELLSQVSLARAMILEKLERRPAGNDTDALRRRLAEVDTGFKGIAVEWHRFSLHEVEALCIKALDTLEAIYGDLDGRTVETRDAPPAARGSARHPNELLLKGELELAFVCSGTYAALPKDAPVELIAVPVVRDRAVYHSIVIVREHDPHRSFADLRGARFAFSDELSNTGHIYPRWLIAEAGETPSTFFTGTILTGSHDRSILAVYRHLVDAAAVHELVYRAIVVPGSPYWGKLRFIDTSPDFATPPVVAPTAVPAEVRAKMRDILAGMNATPEGRVLSMARYIAGESVDLVLYQDLVRLEELLSKAVETDPSFAYAFVVDPANAVMVHTFKGVFPDSMRELNRLHANEPFRVRRIDVLGQT